MQTANHAVASAGDEKASLKGSTQTSSATPLEEDPSYIHSDAPTKNRGLLHVPSRSSSQKVQPSPTSTGLSGVTASDPTDSIGRQSREYGNSIIAEKHNGSVASSKTSVRPAGAIEPSSGKVTSSTLSSAPMPKPKKSRGFLSFLNCCGVPDNANELDSDETAHPVKKVTKISSQTRPTTSSKVASDTLDSNREQVTMTQPEKAAILSSEATQGSASTQNELPQSQEAIPEKSQSGSRDARNQPLPALPQDAEKSMINSETSGVSSPKVVVQAPTPIQPQEAGIPIYESEDSHQPGSVHDVSMPDAPEAPTENAIGVADNSHGEMPAQQTSTLPPPPPIPAPDSNKSSSNPVQESTVTDTAEVKQQWLLPPIEPRFQGKKCLVLDLDETLVHSSFKVYLHVQVRYLPN